MAESAKVMFVEPGAVAVQGIYAGTILLDTVSSFVLVGERLAAEMGLDAANAREERGVLVHTAEGGEAKCMPRSRQPVEITLLPNTKMETKVRVHCVLSNPRSTIC